MITFGSLRILQSLPGPESESPSIYLAVSHATTFTLSHIPGISGRCFATSLPPHGPRSGRWLLQRDAFLLPVLSIVTGSVSKRSSYLHSLDGAVASSLLISR